MDVSGEAEVRIIEVNCVDRHKTVSEDKSSSGGRGEDK